MDKSITKRGYHKKMKRVISFILILLPFHLLLIGCSKNNEAIYSHERNIRIDERFANLIDEMGVTASSDAQIAGINKLYQEAGTFVATMETQRIIDYLVPATVVFDLYASTNPIFQDDNRSGGMGFGYLEPQQQPEQAISEIELIFGMVNRFYVNEWDSPFINKELYHGEHSFQEVSKFIDDRVEAINQYLYLGRDDIDDEDGACEKKERELVNRVRQEYEHIVKSMGRAPNTVQECADYIAEKTFVSEKVMVTAMIDYCHFIVNRIEGFDVMSESEYATFVSRIKEAWNKVMA